MTAQRIPGPEGVGAYPQSMVDDGTLVRTSTATPGLGGILGETWQINSALSAEERRAISKIIGFCKEMEDIDLAADLERAVDDEALDFGEVSDGNHAAWDPVTNTITISQTLLTQILYPKSLDSVFRDLIEVTALLAHELKHHQEGRLTWALDSFADPNRTTGAHWASYGAWGLMWRQSQATLSSLASPKAVNWTLRSINRFEQSVWQVGLQKRLNWAQHEHQRLEQLQTVNASRGEQIGVARRVKVICDDFLIYHNEALSLSSQMSQLSLTSTNGKTIIAVNARQEIERYASEATQIIQGQ
ncbi:MAG: hypothetical protein EKK68_10235 [Candidatus Competibacteraceae bacterium]|nr:MAG: hypothetical protein EKK68_10235 [Candidatus Competibacteraceae bacterium]